MAGAFPHLSQVKDPQAGTTLRLLWDRIHACAAALAQARADRAKMEERLSQIPGFAERLALAASRARG